MYKDKKKVDSIYYDKIDDSVFLSILKRRREESETHWQKKNLKEVRAKNNQQYLTEYVTDQLVDERYQEIYADNRQFVSVRTIVPFLSNRVTAPEVTPSDGKDLSIQFAKDFEEILQKHIEKQQGKAKIRLSIQDLLRGERVGILKWRFDDQLNTVILERIDPATVTIGKRSKQLEEPDFISQEIECSIYDLCRMFPDKKDKIYKLFGIEKGTPSQLEKLYTIKEEWIWVDTEEKRELVVGWSYQNCLFGKIKDPNWSEDGKNVIDSPMMPYVFFNFLNDGSSYIDQTSFMEQSWWLQRNYNKRGQTIAENAKYGGTGVPIFAKGAISQKDVAKIRFSPIQRVLLDTQDMNKAFTVWQSTPLPQYIVDDKLDDRNSIDNIWGTPNVFRGEQSKNNTLGQDVMIRDQSEGRLGDPIDCIDNSMTHLYQLEAQLMYRYFDQKKYMNYLGNDGKFVSLVISSEDIANNLGISISVKAGSSLPIDKAQKRATVMQLLQLGKVSTLVAYKELGVFEDPEAAYKQYVLEINDPASSLADVDKQVFSREASEDIQLVLGGETPEEREDIENDYLEYLNNWLLTDKFKMLQTNNPEAAANLSAFVDNIIEKANRKLNKMQMQPAAPDEVPPEVQAEIDAQAGNPAQPVVQ
jgi:hypothetical protein